MASFSVACLPKVVSKSYNWSLAPCFFFTTFCCPRGWHMSLGSPSLRCHSPSSCGKQFQGFFPSIFFFNIPNLDLPLWMPYLESNYSKWISPDLISAPFSDFCGHQEWVSACYYLFTISSFPCILLLELVCLESIEGHRAPLCLCLALSTTLLQNWDNYPVLANGFVSRVLFLL